MFVPLAFEQSLRPYLHELARFETVQELERSSVYRKLKPDIDRVLNHVWHEDLAAPVAASGNSVRAVAWNIERGIHLARIIQSLREHPSLEQAHVLFLSELDWGMARTHNSFAAPKRFPARRI